MKIVLIDTETTDLKNPRLVQLAWKEDEKEPEQIFYKPAVPISFDAMATHHITNKDVVDKEAITPEIIKKWNEFFSDKIAVAHNLQFDVQVLRNEGIEINKGICTLKLARFLFPNEEQYKLQYLRYSLDLNVEKGAVAHNAIGDVIVLNKFFRICIKEIQSRNIHLNFEEIINKMIEITGQPSLVNKFTFGKHIRKNIVDVIKEDPSYISWLLNQKTLDEDLRYSLNYYFKRN